MCQWWYDRHLALSQGARRRRAAAAGPGAADAARREQKGHCFRRSAAPRSMASPPSVQHRQSNRASRAAPLRRYALVFQTRATYGFTARAALAGASSSRERILGSPARLASVGQPKGCGTGQPKVGGTGHGGGPKLSMGRANGEADSSGRAPRRKDAPGASRPATTPPAPQTTTPRMPPSPKYHFPPPVVAPTAGQPSQLSKQGSAARGPLGAAAAPRPAWF